MVFKLLISIWSLLVIINVISSTKIDLSGLSSDDQEEFERIETEIHWQEFQHISRRDGYISFRDLKLVMKEEDASVTHDDIQTFMDELDINIDNRISWEEYSNSIFSQEFVTPDQIPGLDDDMASIIEETEEDVYQKTFGFRKMP